MHPPLGRLYPEFYPGLNLSIGYPVVSHPSVTVIPGFDFPAIVIIHDCLRWFPLPPPSIFRTSVPMAFPFPCQSPPPLSPGPQGSRLVAIAPSGTLREQEAFHQGVTLWRNRGYHVDLAPGYDDRLGYLAGHDTQRRQQLTQAWQDPHYHGVLCVRGGWGAARLLEDWQWPRVAGQVPVKWLIGFSDITSLLWSLACQGISGVHGPVLTTLSQEPPESLTRLWHWLEGHRTLEPLRGHSWGDRTVARGYLLPANLTVATHLLGTALVPPLDGVILALEDVGEAPYRLDRLLTQWRMTGNLAQVKGIALGRFSSCDPPAHLPSWTVQEVLHDRLGDLGIPIVSELPFGHEGCNYPLPVGVLAELNGDRGELTVVEL